MQIIFSLINSVIGVIAIAFLMTQFKVLGHGFQHSEQRRTEIVSAIVFFSLCAVISILNGYSLDLRSLELHHIFEKNFVGQLIISMSMMWLVLSACFGGASVSIGVGIIIAFVYLLMGGKSSLVDVIITLLMSIAVPYVLVRNKSQKPLKLSMIVGLSEIFISSIHMLLAQNIQESIQIFKYRMVPLTVISMISAFIFLIITQSILYEKGRTMSSQAEKILHIADLTISPLRDGLTANSGMSVCDILYRELDVKGVAVTDTTHILAHLGMTPGVHSVDMSIKTKATMEVIKTGQIHSVANIETYREFDYSGCAVIAPLKVADKTIGTLKIYFDNPVDEPINLGMLRGLSKLLSEQLEVGMADRTLELARESEINALQAQINPHFLFNSINIISSLIRTNPDEARSLLNDLSDFIRGNVKAASNQMVTLKEELTHLKSYLTIIEARFIDRLEIRYEIDIESLSLMVPRLTLQPLVENAINHGFENKDVDCRLTISIVKNHGYVEVRIIDNGQGIHPERLKLLTHQEVPSEFGTGIALYNVSRRLIMTFGEGSKINIRSKEMQGTEIQFLIHLGGVF